MTFKGCGTIEEVEQRFRLWLGQMADDRARENLTAMLTSAEGLEAGVIDEFIAAQTAGREQAIQRTIDQWKAAMRDNNISDRPRQPAATLPAHERTH